MTIKNKIIITTPIVCIFFLLTAIILYNNCSSPKYFISNINHIMKIYIPDNKITYFTKDSGDFHGDGNTIMILTLTDEDNNEFKKNLDVRWKKLNQKSKIYNYLWGSENTGGMLNERLYPASDTVFILFDYTNKKTNEQIDFNDITDFYYVGYSYKNGIIYIQKTNI